MRAEPACMLLMLLTACSREPSFDERYSNAAHSIAGRANELDTEFNRSAPESPETNRAEAGATRSAELAADRQN